MKPRATQTVRKTSGKWGTIRIAVCPDHQQRSIDYSGDTAAGWEFICRENAKHTRHRFYATPDKNAPKTPAEASQWFAEEVAKQVVNPTKNLT